MVLDRSIGHARGNGPHDDESVEKVLATPETPFCVYSASKAITAMVVHILDERGALHIGDRVADHIPGVRRTRQGRRSRSRTCSPTAPASRGCPPARSSSTTSRTASSSSRRSATSSPRCGRDGRWPTTRSRAGSSSARSASATTGKDDPRGPARRGSRPARVPLGQLRGRREDLDQVALAYVTGPPLLPPISTLRRARAQRADRQGRRDLQRPALSDRDRARRPTSSRPPTS